MSLEQQLDEVLIQMTSQIGNGLDGLLDQFFGFLQRRTDFYYEQEPGDKMGFPPGVAEGKWFNYFKKYQIMHFKKFPQKEGLVERWKEYTQKQKEQAEAKKTQEADSKVEEVEEEKKEISPEEKAKLMTQQIKKDNAKELGVPPPTSIPEPPKEAPKEMQDISTYNGDSTDKYKWSQDITEVIVQIDLPEGTSAKSLEVDIKTKYLKVKNKATGDEYIDGELFEKISPEDWFWSIEDKKRLILTLTKGQEVIWKTIIVGDQEIDPKTVDNSKRIDQFDQETQGHLQKVLYEQNRKLNGLPTTEEMEQQKLMEKVMNAENSPFKDSPYDPPKYGEGPQIPFKQ